jgi:hypothetical protein
MRLITQLSKITILIGLYTSKNGKDITRELITMLFVLKLIRHSNLSNFKHAKCRKDFKSLKKCKSIKKNSSHNLKVWQGTCLARDS